MLTDPFALHRVKTPDSCFCCSFPNEVKYKFATYLIFNKHFPQQFPLLFDRASYVRLCRNAKGVFESILPLIFPTSKNSNIPQRHRGYNLCKYSICNGHYLTMQKRQAWHLVATKILIPKLYIFCIEWLIRMVLWHPILYIYMLVHLLCRRLKQVVYCFSWQTFPRRLATRDSLRC